MAPRWGCPGSSSVGGLWSWGGGAEHVPLPAGHPPTVPPVPLQMKELQLVLSEANESLRGLQEQLSQERQLRKDEVDNFSQKICQVSRRWWPREKGSPCVW